MTLTQVWWQCRSSKWHSQLLQSLSGSRVHVFSCRLARGLDTPADILQHLPGGAVAAFIHLTHSAVSTCLAITVPQAAPSLAYPQLRLAHPLAAPCAEATALRSCCVTAVPCARSMRAETGMGVFALSSCQRFSRSSRPLRAAPCVGHQFTEH